MKIYKRPIWLVLNLVLLGVKIPFLIFYIPIKLIKGDELDFIEYFGFIEFGLEE